MNYILGAVNAISAPYQYYKDLPPINPSTLTGAIDVIVVQRPTTDGGSELACSPFHVRFGKWQVLRPAEKKVNVSVNGNPIPYNMKVGEAGEAFFVFETEDDVPDDLITSPIIHPTRTEGPQELSLPPAVDAIKPVVQGAVGDEAMPEPEFLDLNAMPYVGHPPPSPVNNSASDQQFPSSPLPTSPSQASSASTSSLPAHQESVPDLLDTESTPLNVRATSEPPPDTSEDHRPGRPPAAPLKTNLPLAQYSWDWGGFPQPSPMKASFGKSRRPDGGSIGGIDMNASWDGTTKPIENDAGNSAALISDEEVTKNKNDPKIHRSQSVPPELEGSPTLRRVALPKFESYNEDNRQYGFVDEDDIQRDLFGAGGRLSPSKTDETLFIVKIEGRKMSFELSIVTDGAAEDTSSESGQHSRRSSQDDTKQFLWRSEVETARLFDQGKVSYSRFIEDESIVMDERLVIRWADNQYITRRDGSPLMNSLVLWRDAVINTRDLEIPSRSPSPSSDDALSSDERDYKRKDSEQLEKRHLSRKPASSSWVRWWKRGKAKETDSIGTQPALHGSTTSLPSTNLRTDPVMQVSQQPQPEIYGIQAVPPSVSNQIAAPHQQLLTPPPETGVPEGRPGKKKYAKTLRLTSDQLGALNLKPGANSITFSLSTTGVIACTARIFLWDSTDIVVVSDIDGTITKSDGLGHVFAMIGKDWTHVGVAKLYTDISRNGYKLMYLTSRAIGQADATRGYLKGIKQNDHQLPEGPVIMSPDRLIASLHREVIMRKPELFKMACLRDIQKLFGEASRNPFYAGFGNRITDALSYRSVDVPSARIFTIDSSGEVKMELLELAGYKSSYIHMTDLVDQMFPPIHRKWVNDFTDFNYWKAPVQDFSLPDLTPPSPALSARSDTSNQSTLSKLRNFSLVTKRYTSSRTPVLPPPVTAGNLLDGGQRTPQLKQMSSFERLGAALAGFAPSSSASPSGSRRSTSLESRASSSLTYADTVSDDEYGDEWDGMTKDGRRRVRTRSMTSMPGSLDDIHFAIDNDYGDNAEDKNEFEGRDEGEIEFDRGQVENAEEVNEEAFDEDFLATTQMKNVPFL